MFEKYKRYLPSRNNQGLQRPGQEDKHSIINVLFVLNRNKTCFQQDLLILALLIQLVVMILLSWTIFGVWGLHRCKNLLCFFFALLAHERVWFFIQWSLSSFLFSMFYFIREFHSLLPEGWVFVQPRSQGLCASLPLTRSEGKEEDPGNEVEIFAESNPYLLSWKEHLVCLHKTVLSETTNGKKNRIMSTTLLTRCGSYDLLGPLVVTRTKLTQSYQKL